MTIYSLDVLLFPFGTRLYPVKYEIFPIALYSLFSLHLDLYGLSFQYDNGLLLGLPASMLSSLNPPSAQVPKWSIWNRHLTRVICRLRFSVISYHLKLCFSWHLIPLRQASYLSLQVHFQFPFFFCVLCCLLPWHFLKCSSVLTTWNNTWPTCG